jgi:HK97 family phage portal protein
MKIVVKGGIVVGYQCKTQNKSIDYQLDEVVHFQYPSADKAPYGMGIIEAGAVIFDIENAINRYQKRYFDNDAQPRFVLTTENKLSEVEFKRFIEGFNKSYRGSNNANKAMILSQGFKPATLSDTPKEVDFVNTWKTIQTRTLSLFGVHPALVGIIEDVNRANAIEAQTIFTDRTVAPIVKRIDNTITKFARNTWRDLSLKVVHKIESPSDRVQQLDEMKVALEGGVISINEFRAWLGAYDEVPNGDVIGKVAV